MKRIAITIFLGGLIFFGCKPDPVEETAPTDTNPKAKFIANWTCNEVSKRDGTAQPYDVHIIDSAGTADYVLLENFYALGFNKKVKAQVSGNTITVTPQTISGIAIVSATCNMENSSTLKWNYIIDDGQAVKDTCTATYTKQ